MRENLYNTNKELRLIEKWDVKEVFTLLDYIEGLWWNKEWGFIKKWGRDDLHNKPVVKLELHTGGWSGNEDIINALLKNQMFTMLWYSQWNRGGHYKFEIDPFNIGFEPAGEIARKKGITRQAIHKSKEYEKLKTSDKVFLFREIK